MSNSTSLSLDQLPWDILLHIFCNLNVPDIGRIRRVSRYLNAASHFKEMWCNIYRTAGFVCPPGPFPSQSARDLENILVSSFKVDRNVRNRYCGNAARETPMLLPKKIRYTGVAIFVGLLFGRFLLIAFEHEVHCHDLDLCDLRANIIYRSTSGGLRRFYCNSAIDVEGRPFACVVLSEEAQETTQTSIYSLDVEKQSKVTLHLLHRLEPGGNYGISVHLGPRVIVVQRQAGRDVFAMDVHSRTSFSIPSFSIEMLFHAEQMRGPCPYMFTVPTSISTSTHLILASSYSLGVSDGWKTLFRVFTLPHSDPHCCFPSTPSHIPLNPSHGGIISGIKVDGTVLLRDSVSDPVTGDVLVSIAVRAFDPSPASHVMKHGVLRLSAVPASHDHELGTIRFQSLDDLGQLAKVPFLHPTFNGAGRVFYVVDEKSASSVSVLEYNLRALGDDGDDGEDRVVEFPSVLRLPGIRLLCDYDPYSCRICTRSAMESDVIEVFDLAA